MSDKEKEEAADAGEKKVRRRPGARPALTVC